MVRVPLVWGTRKVVRWYAKKFIKILKLKKSDETTLLTKGEVHGAKK